MKTVLKYTWSLLVAFSLIVMVSCGDDEDPIIIDPGGEGINVADGLYMTIDGEDPSSTAALVAEVVEAEGFSSQDRSGFNAGYMYLAAGNYNVVQITDKEVTATFGGTGEVVTDDGSLCDHNDYTVITTAENGAAVAVDAGFYKVSHDQMTNELVLYNISDASVIGSATPNGWGGDTPLSGNIDASGGSWSASGVILRSGEWKIRFNCRWGINRRIDPNGTLDDPANGYQLFTNYGGSESNLVTGGSNIQQAEDGEYTLTLNWDPRDGFSMDVERTGDAPNINFNPNDFQMAVIGDGTNSEDLDGNGTPDGWQSDRNLFHKFENDVHSWYGVVTFGDSGKFKFRANDAWDFNLGGDLTALAGGGDDIDIPGSGAYYIILSTADEGDTWSATIENIGWGLIGEGCPSASWDNDFEMTANGNVGGISTYTATGDFTTANWKFRAGGDWAHNLGGDLTFLNTDGSDISLAAGGSFTATLSFDGEVYTATVE